MVQSSYVILSVSGVLEMFQILETIHTLKHTTCEITNNTKILLPCSNIVGATTFIPEPLARMSRKKSIGTITMSFPLCLLIMTHTNG